MPFSQYTTTVAQASALSSALLTRSQAERMLSASTAEESFRVLYDLSWATSASDASGAEDFENVLSAGLYEVKMALGGVNTEKNMAHVLFFPFDLQNAKTSLSAFAKGKTYEDIRDDLSPLSFYPRKTAYNILTEKGAPAEAAFFEKALLAAKKIQESSIEDISRAQDILDAAFFTEIYTAAKNTQSAAVLAVIQKQIDGENIKKVLRTSGPIFFLSPQIPAGYQILSAEEATGKLAFSSLKKFLEKGISLLAEGKGVSECETQMDLQIVEDLFWAARTHPAGAENILLLFLTKLRNAELIRMILVGKRNGFSEEEIREMASLFLSFLPHA